MTEARGPRGKGVVGVGGMKHCSEDTVAELGLSPLGGYNSQFRASCFAVLVGLLTSISILWNVVIRIRQRYLAKSVSINSYKPNTDCDGALE